MNHELITERYTIIKELGRGGYGIVYLGQNKADGQLVALKTISVTPKSLPRITGEISALQGLADPCQVHIACYYGSFYDPEQQVVVIEMQYVDGPDVAVYTDPLRIRGNNNLLILTCKLLLIYMIQALMKIHETGLLHNDVKPDNIVVSSDRIPVLVDFGVACHTLSETDRVCTETFQEVIGKCCQERVVTAFYLPPEAITGVRYTGSDYWSLGASIFNLLTGKVVWNIDFVGKNAIQLYESVIDYIKSGGQPLNISSRDKALDTVVNNFLNYDITKRMTGQQALDILIPSLKP